jgi:hypothetical protein
MSHELHPLELEFVNTQIKFKETSRSVRHTEKPIGVVLLTLSTKRFEYIDVMRDYIELMKQKIVSIERFIGLVNNICDLAGRYMETDGNGKWKFQKEQVLKCLNHEIEWVPIQINSDMMQNMDGLFKNPIYYAIVNSGYIGEFFIKLLQKIHHTMNLYDERATHDNLFNICRHLNGQVVPILQVLTDLNQKQGEQGGDDFIKHLDLTALIEKLKQIKQRESLMSTVKSYMESSIMPRVKSLVAEAEAAGNASQYVMGDSTFSAKGGRRTRRHKKRSGKRSGHNKRSGRKSRRR